MAKKKEELKEVKEVVKAPVLRLNENDDPVTEEPLSDVKPFVVNFGKSWLRCTEVIERIEQDPETSAKKLIVTMGFDGQLNGNENSELAGEIVFSGNIEEE